MFGETGERIVVALAGDGDDADLLRRAAQLAGAAPVYAVHVARNDGSPERSGNLAAQRALAESLGASFHSVVGARVPEALARFARSVDATQVILGAAARLSARPGSIAGTLVRLIPDLDVHVVRRGQAHPPRRRWLPWGGLSRNRQLAGALSAVVLLGVLTPSAVAMRSSLNLAGTVPLYLLVVIITSLIGGLWVALVTAVVAIGLLDYFFAKPIHTLRVTEPESVVALIVFIIAAVLVSRMVDFAARRSAEAASASAEAEILSTLAGSLLRGEHALPALLQRIQETFGVAAVSLLERRDAGVWRVLATSGNDAPESPETADGQVQVDADQMLAMRGPALAHQDQRLLTAFATEVAVAYRQRGLSESAESLAETDRQRTALLNAVGHDLRTPLASAKAAVSSLRMPDVRWDQGQTDELLAEADRSMDRLTDLVANLLDLSRLEAGALPVMSSMVGLDDVVSRALDHLPTEPPISVEIPEDLPEVAIDAGLMERVIANLVQNALRSTAAGSAVGIVGLAIDGRVQLRIVDHGPGIPAGKLAEIFAPFHRLSDAPADGGVGLGLAVARGFTEAMAGRLSAESTPGGGATFVISLPVPA